MAWARAAARASATAGAACLVVVLGLAALPELRPSAAWADAAASLRLEPGVPLDRDEFLAPFTALDSTGAAVAPDREELALDLDGVAAGSLRLVTFAPAAGGIASASLLLVNLGGLDPEQAAGVAGAAGDFLRPGAGDAWRGLAASGRGLRQLRRLSPPGRAGAEQERTVQGLAREAAAGGARIWDGIGEALALLSASELPPRRVLLVVTGGGGELDNRLTSASCLEAALAARAAIYALHLTAATAPGVGPGGQEGATARLRRLAEQSGGRLIVAGADADPGEALRRLIALADGAQGVVFAAPGLGLPAALTLRSTLGGQAVSATGTVQRRLRLGGGGAGPWPAAGLTLLALGAAAGLVARQRFGSAGELLVSTEGGRSSHRLPRSGASLGSAAGNTVVIADRRVSANHAVLRPRRGRLILTDLRSTHGTEVNGRPVRTADVVQGDRIVLGRAVEVTYLKSRPRR